MKRWGLDPDTRHCQLHQTTPKLFVLLQCPNPPITKRRSIEIKIFFVLICAKNAQTNYAHFIKYKYISNKQKLPLLMFQFHFQTCESKIAYIVGHFPLEKMPKYNTIFYATIQLCYVKGG